MVGINRLGQRDITPVQFDLSHINRHPAIGQAIGIKQSDNGFNDDFLAAQFAHDDIGDTARRIATGLRFKSIHVVNIEGGICGGKGGSMHMFSREKKFFGGHGIVGAQVPIGVGLAFSHKYKSESNVCLTYLGDGAVNQGQVYESFNMAALWRLPCLFIIENNQYGMGTAVTRAAAGRALADRGLAYGIPGKQVDGMDVLAVRAAALEALAHCRDGHGPFILEMKTYRYRGHSMSDPAKYRTREEVDAMRKQHDPIDQMRDLLKNQNITDEQLKSIDSDVKSTVTKATEFAQTSPEPDVSELFTDILLPVDDGGQPAKV